MQIIMLGAPGVGKGTQSKLLSKHYNIPQISTGDILRDARDNGTELGKKIKKIIEQGELVSDEIVNKLVQNKLRSKDCENGFILDGYPRTSGQAKTLDDFLNEHDSNRLHVVHIDVPSDELIHRLINRRKCNSCKSEFNLLSIPNHQELCPVCGSPDLFTRKDDNHETVTVRQITYERETMPLIEYYHKVNKLKTFNGFKDIEILFQEIIHSLEKETV